MLISRWVNRLLMIISVNGCWVLVFMLVVRVVGSRLSVVISVVIMIGCRCRIVVLWIVGVSVMLFRCSLLMQEMQIIVVCIDMLNSVRKLIFEDIENGVLVSYSVMMLLMGVDSVMLSMVMKGNLKLLQRVNSSRKISFMVSGMMICSCVLEVMYLEYLLFQFM